MWRESTSELEIIIFGRDGVAAFNDGPDAAFIFLAGSNLLFLFELPAPLSRSAMALGPVNGCQNHSTVTPLALSDG